MQTMNHGTRWMKVLGKAVSQLSSYKYSADTDDECFCLSDDPEIHDGAHVSVQVVARRLQEEKVLALTEILARALNCSNCGVYGQQAK